MTSLAPSSRSIDDRSRLGSVVAAVAVVLVLAGCAGSDVVAGSEISRSSEPPGPEASAVPDDPEGGLGGSGPVAPAEPYALLHAPGWELDRALDAGPDDVVGAGEQPPVEWFAEYERSTVGAPPADSGFPGTMLTVDAVRVSGHVATMDAFREAYEGYGFVFRPSPLGDRAALVATASPTDPAILVAEMGPGTVLLLSYGLGTDELVELAAHLAPADEAAWLAAGGEIW
jgi:hypothetical protein